MLQRPGTERLVQGGLRQGERIFAFGTLGEVCQGGEPPSWRKSNGDVSAMAVEIGPWFVGGGFGMLHTDTLGRVVVSIYVQSGNQIT